MKMIHMADVHLDSKVEAHLSKEQAAERRQELMDTFLRAIDYAGQEDVCAVLLCGELFDAARVSRATVRSILSAIGKHPGITFFCLRGDQDRIFKDAEGGDRAIMEEAFGSDASAFQQQEAQGFAAAGEEEKIPENLILIGDKWQQYRISEKVVITAVSVAERKLSYSGEAQDAGNDSGILEMNPHGDALADGMPALRKEDCNIVMLSENILPEGFGNESIDYIALACGSSPEIGSLGGRGIYACPGCLEGRSFMECGPHGFYVLEFTGGGELEKIHFKDIAGRHMWRISVDIGDLRNSGMILERIKGSIAALEGTLTVPEAEIGADGFAIREKKCGFVRKEDFLCVLLRGEVNPETEKNTTFLTDALSEDYSFVMLKDETRVKLDYQPYLQDRGLKGEFVREMEKDEELSEEIRDEVIRLGLQLLMGDEILWN